MKRLISVALAAAVAYASYSQETIVLSLNRCREMALESSESIQIAGGEVRKADYDKKIAVSGYLPKFSGMGMGMYVTPDIGIGTTELSMKGAYMAGISLMQPVFAGGRIVTGNKLARIGQTVAQAKAELAEDETILNADNSYWTYLAVLEKLKVINSYMEQLDAILYQTETALAADMATRESVLKVRSRRSELIYQKEQAQNGAELCRMSLCVAIGVPMDTRIELVDTAFVFMDPDRTDGGIEQRPESRMLSASVEAARQQIKMTRGEYLPTLGLSVGYIYLGGIDMNGTVEMGGMSIPYTNTFEKGLGTGVLALKVPVFQWGEGANKIKKAKIDLSNAELERNRNTSLMQLELVQARQNYLSGIHLVESAAAALADAEEHLRVEKERYAVSYATLSEYLDAESACCQARSNFTEAQVQCKINETAYLKACGAL